MKHILIFATCVALAMPTYASNQCEDLKNEIQGINGMQNDIVVRDPNDSTKTMDLRTAKKKRDAILAEALAMQAIINIKNDYNEVNKRLNGSTIEKALSKKAFSIFEDVKGNMEKMYTYGLVKHSVKAMALAHVLDKSYERHAENSKAFNTAYDAPHKDLLGYMESCKGRTGHLLGKSGLKDNLNEYVNAETESDEAKAKAAENRRARIIKDFDRNCEQTQKLLKHLKNDPDMYAVMKTQLENLSGLYKKVEGNSSLKNLQTQVEHHDIYLQTMNDDKDFNQRIDNSYNLASHDTFERNFDAYHSIYSAAKRSGSTRMDDLVTTINDNVEGSINAKAFGADMLFSSDKGADEFKAFKQAIKDVENKCLNVSLEKCSQTNDPSIKKFTTMLSDYAKKMDKTITPEEVFAKAGDLDSEKDELQKKIKQRFSDLEKKMKNLAAKHKGSGITNPEETFSKNSALLETLDNIGCKQYAANIETTIQEINNTSGIGKCLNDKLTKDAIDTKLKLARETIQGLDRVINDAISGDKKFRDLEKIKYLASLNYSSSCHDNGTAEVTEVSLIGTDDTCLQKYFQTDSNNRVNASVTGLMKETNNAISEFLADDFIKDLGEGKDFIKDRRTWVNLHKEYCKDIEVSSKCSETDKMCNTCKFVDKHKKEVFLYEKKIERNKLSKGMYREWDPVKKRMINKKHPISNIYAHTAKYFAKNLGAFMMPKIGMYQFRTGLIQAEQNAMFMKQQYHWQQQINDNMLTNPALFDNFYGTTPSIGMGMPITTSQ